MPMSGRLPEPHEHAVPRTATREKHSAKTRSPTSITSTWHTSRRCETLYAGTSGRTIDTRMKGEERDEHSLEIRTAPSGDLRILPDRRTRSVARRWPSPPDGDHGSGSPIRDHRQQRRPVG